MVQCTQSTVDPPTTTRKITQFFHQTTAKTNDGVVEPACRADPGCSDVEFPDRELLSTAGDECSAEEAVTLVICHQHCLYMYCHCLNLHVVHPPQCLALYQTLVTC